MSLRLGTRRSTLATTQSQWVADRLGEHGHACELVEVTTFGDTSTAPLTSIGGTGVFVSALRQALLTGQIDLAVHSLKDLPVAPEPGLVIAAVPEREDPRDVLVARDGLRLHDLPRGAVVGTGAPRRAAQLAALGLGLEIRPIRGNVDTRIQLVRRGEVDAIVLARAGLARLGRLDEATDTLEPEDVLGAAGQGALAVECRADDDPTIELLSAIDDPRSRAEVAAERSLLATLEAGCTAPIGARARISMASHGTQPVLTLEAFIGREDGTAGLRRSRSGRVTGADQVGRELAELLLGDGAADLVASGDTSSHDATGTIASHPHPAPAVPSPEKPRASADSSTSAPDPASRPDDIVTERAQ
ncbi:MAG TPA: hydroxymethylbilane synthase [Segeticoccus sp.]|uniref:hydroxymethylbilane synthase n=1 Tax=Segeticoccus sp. TaxID=2706531 RepID=UPI002D807DBE|nr:hydroxymethylbilane synthase [Segeticoccus sp.]HET8599183.1 hydroxymethylbilane synthase [Segeticoccus sp.]